MIDPRARQLQREKAQRDAALGRRAREILRGDLGPVLKRWVNGTVSPVAARVRLAAEALLAGDYASAEGALQSEVFGLFEARESPALRPILEWLLRGGSPGRGQSATYADDLVLAVLATAIRACASEAKPCPLTRLLGECASVTREAALGQFITQVQGARAMMRVRQGGRSGWAQTRQMDQVAALLSGQVRSALTALPIAEDTGIALGGRSIVYIQTVAGERRRIDLKPPSLEDWKFLDVVRHVKGEKDPHKSTWVSFAMLVLCAAQAEAGWFDLVRTLTTPSSSMQRRRRTRGRAHSLVLSNDAHDAIRKDLERWMTLGFQQEPMVVAPERGDYLSVKHRAVAGRKGPLGMKTRAESSTAWEVACEVMAGTAWSVPEGTLKALRESEFIRSLAAKSEPDAVRLEVILGEYRRVAAEPEIYLPIFMDFRGRVYTRPTWVTYQGTDLQKGLLCFPGGFAGFADYDALALHAAALYGGPQKLDKAPLKERLEWWAETSDPKGRDALLAEADEPIQLLTALTLCDRGQANRIACQIDGTCNGLQHLSALFRDETAAPFVNLTASTLEDRPADIYAEVAKRVAYRIHGIQEPWARRVEAAVRIDRKLCKKPVMVLPYGGTRVTIEDAVLGAILEQAPDGKYWVDGLTTGQWAKFVDGEGLFWPDWIDGNYAAFQGRDLKDHPLLHLDARRLGGLVWDCIVEILPRPMAAMAAFRGIAKGVGERTLEWSTGFGESPLWVVQAKSKSQKTRINFKGFHLPNSVRGLQMLDGKDEIDPGAHTSGIVANFIHSMDARHLATTMDHFRRGGGTSFGAIHDCFLGRPSQMGALGEAARCGFEWQYSRDPLAWPVRLRDPKADVTGGVEEFASWYALADRLGVSFPEAGKWEPAEVLESAWFFS